MWILRIKLGQIILLQEIIKKTQLGQDVIKLE